MGKQPWLLFVGLAFYALYFMGGCTEVRGRFAGHGDDRDDKRYGYRNSGSGTSRDYWSH